ncbi:MAG: hypothetical protein CMJ98_11810 [Planctomycetes bacterium]|jgi:DUF438 domain-containing protein|nr:hypothetical protein [Planctomycetota bacterium]MBV20801.1 hypothetical protein [Planctomycetaceae bacterium]HJM56515.1 DUF438 domain-containing protein [Planctomycetota bacterium]
MDKAQKLASILDRLQRNSSCEDTKLEAREFLRETPPEELMHLEERLARDGAPSEGMRHLCSAHLQVSNGERKAFRDSLPAGHMIAILMDEHELILANLDRLEGLVAPDGPGECEARLGTLESLIQVGQALVDAEPHHAREEDVLFPAVEERGMGGPPAVMRAEHVDLRLMKKGVKNMAQEMLDSGSDEPWAELAKTGRTLVAQLRDHIFKEDNILYPMSVQILTDPLQWEEMSTRADEIGYLPGISREQ